MNYIVISYFIGLALIILSTVIGTKLLILVFKDKNNYYSMKDINIVMNVVLLFSTIIAIPYGLETKIYWLVILSTIGTIVGLVCLVLRLRIEIINKKSDDSFIFSYENSRYDAWMSFEIYKSLSDEDKEIFLKNLHSTSSINKLEHNSIKLVPYEDMPTLDKMYWNKELWDDYCKNKDN